MLNTDSLDEAQHYVRALHNFSNNQNAAANKCKRLRELQSAGQVAWRLCAYLTCLPSETKAYGQSKRNKRVGPTKPQTPQPRTSAKHPSHNLSLVSLCQVFVATAFFCCFVAGRIYLHDKLISFFNLLDALRGKRDKYKNGSKESKTPPARKRAKHPSHNFFLVSFLVSVCQVFAAPTFFS